MNVLFAASEIYPLVKTGGLADVAGYLPRALQSQGACMRVVIPAYSSILEKLGDVKMKVVANLTIDSFTIQIRETFLPSSRIKLWLVDCPPLYIRPGGPYQNENGQDWPDNAERFAIFARVVCAIALNKASMSWTADIVHCHDWQTGLIPALLALTPPAPKTIFTIHNLAYQGLFSYDTFIKLKLPQYYWTADSLEFYGQLSFMKGGLVFADRINTVSPNYAREIKTDEFGCGLDGLLRHRTEHLSGIINGIDTKEWNPNQDIHLKETYNRNTLSKKTINKLALQEMFGLPQSETIPLISIVSRLTHQKGIDLITEALPELLKQPLQIIILGSGDTALEEALLTASNAAPDKLSVKIAYNEPLAHLLIGGSDMFMMPSRFEPCGLTQLYSLRYGTVPIVRNVGGLADTVVDVNNDDSDSSIGTGFFIKDNTASALIDSINRGVALYANPPAWKQIQLAGMKQDFSWKNSAQKYMALYSELIA